MGRLARAGTVLGAVVVVTAATVAPAGAGPAAAQPGPRPAPVAGSTGGGDPYFPAAGNGGYDVRHYDLDLRYTPTSDATGELSATARVVATAATGLTSLSLDLRGLAVGGVRVNGAAAAFTHEGGELVVTPARPLRARLPFVVTVDYGGTTGRPVDPTGAQYGWVSFADGAFVANEPDGASTWYPVNDVPTDKATYSFTVDVPAGTVAVANGDLLSRRAAAGRETFRWLALDPQASYLAMAASGDYELGTDRGPRGLPIVNAVDTDLSATDRAATAEVLALQPEMIAFFEGLFGRYPFRSFGAVVDDDSVGYALENQTRPIYSGPPDESTVAHELAHQWYGNRVTLGQWRDIWLNEGFATYAEWLWEESRGGPTPQQRFDEGYARPADDALWRVPPGDPGPADLFDEAVYLRGAMTLQALRVTIGDGAFFDLLERWAQRPADVPVATADLVALAERVSGAELDPLVDAWLYTAERPPLP